MRVLLYCLIPLFVCGAIIFSFRPVENKELIFLSGAGMKVPVSKIAEQYERNTGTAVQVHFEGSSILRDYVGTFKTGDLFLPGDKKNLETLEEKGLIRDKFFLAWHVVAILVAPELKDTVRSLDDLAAPGLRLAMSNPRLASLGRIVTQKIMERHPRGRQIMKNVVVYGSSSQDVLRLYHRGGIDAIIEWDVMATTPEGEGLVKVPLTGPYEIRDELVIGLLNTAQYPEEARRFFNYLRENGREVFRQCGYNVDPTWKKTP